MRSIDAFFTVIDAYKRAHGVSDARISTLVFNDGSKIAAIRSGKDVGARRLERAFKWFSKNWPSAAEWPQDIPRPSTVDPVEGDSAEDRGAA